MVRHLILPVMRILCNQIGIPIKIFEVHIRLLSAKIKIHKDLLKIIFLVETIQYLPAKVSVFYFVARPYRHDSLTSALQPFTALKSNQSLKCLQCQTRSFQSGARKKLDRGGALRSANGPKCHKCQNHEFVNTSDLNAVFFVLYLVQKS